jgi:hypothetical protein
MKEYLPETRESLWLLTAAPVIWAVHFLLSYISAAVWCAKFAAPGGLLGGMRTTLAVYTVLALAGIAFVGWVGVRRFRSGDAATPHDRDVPEDRHRFLGFATLLLAGLSGVAVLYVALAAVVFDTCH